MGKKFKVKFIQSIHSSNILIQLLLSQIKIIWIHFRNTMKIIILLHQVILKKNIMNQIDLSSNSQAQELILQIQIYLLSCSKNSNKEIVKYHLLLLQEILHFLKCNLLNRMLIISQSQNLLVSLFTTLKINLCIHPQKYKIPHPLKVLVHRIEELFQCHKMEEAIKKKNL